MNCLVLSFGVSMGLLWLWAVHLKCSGLHSCFSEELPWCLLHWNLLALAWSLVSVLVWKLFGGLLSINFPWSQEFSDVLKFWS